MMMLSRKFESLLLSGAMTLGLAVVSTATVSAQSFGADGGFILRPGKTSVQIADHQSSSSYRICVRSGTTPAARNVGARVITDRGEHVIWVGRCGRVEGSQVEVVPARSLGGFQRVSGNYTRLN